MNHRWSLIVVALIVLLTGCSAKSVMDKIAPETVREAKANFDYLRHQQYDQIEPNLDASVSRSNLRNNLSTMAALVPQEDPVSVKTVGANVLCQSRAGCSTRVTLEYEFHSKWILVELIVKNQDAKSPITSFSVIPESESVEATNSFTLSGKGISHYIILAAAMCSAAIMIVSMVLCIRTPIQKRKWLWIIAILIGVGQSAMNWTTGEVTDRLLWITILPAGFMTGPYSPWIVSVSVPLGAILFLIFRDRIRKVDTPSTPASEELVDVTTA